MPVQPLVGVVLKLKHKSRDLSLRAAQPGRAFSYSLLSDLQAMQVQPGAQLPDQLKSNPQTLPRRQLQLLRPLLVNQQVIFP